MTLELVFENWICFLNVKTEHTENCKLQLVMKVGYGMADTDHIAIFWTSLSGNDAKCTVRDS